jgi:cobalt-zinc-cadmium efflux system outer membrane protein
MMKSSMVLILTVALFLLAACASVETEREWNQLRETAFDNTGKEIIWERSGEDEKEISKRVDELLSGGITKDETVQIALMNNRSLQSTFEEIGIAKSDLVQAGLFSNPSLGALFRFPFRGGSTNIEAYGGFTLSEVWQIPLREKVAAAKMEQTLFRVAEEVLKTVAEAGHAYDRLYYSEQYENETGKIVTKLREMSDRMKVRRNFGFGSDLDIYMSESVVAEAEVEAAQIGIELEMARSRLNRVMGLGDKEIHYTMPEKGRKLPPPVPDIKKAIQFALEHRFDIQMARYEIVRSERALDLEKMRILKDVHLEASYEKDVDGGEALGPGIDIQLPLFDQNQAQIAKAEYVLRKAEKDLQILSGKIREEIQGDLSRIHSLKTQLNIYRKKIIPLHRKAIEYTEKWMNTMQLNRLAYFEAQKDLLHKRREYFETLLNLENAITDLELHMGGRLPMSDK